MPRNKGRAVDLARLRARQVTTVRVPPSFPPTSLDELVQAMSVAKNVDDVEFKAKVANQEWFGEFGRALECNPKLETLQVIDCNLTGRAAGLMVGNLRSLTKLTRLDLSENAAFGDEGAAAVANALEHLPALEDVILYSCNIHDAGATTLASAMPRVAP